MITLAKIIDLISPLEVVGNRDVYITDVLPFEQYDLMHQSSLMWLNAVNAPNINSIKKGIVIAGTSINKSLIHEDLTLIIVDNPRRAFTLIINTFFKEDIIATIHPSAIIDESALIGNNVSIGANTIIEKKCVIGNNVTIGYNNVIKSKTIIEDNVSIGSNNTIGDFGFGYEKDEEGNYERIIHLGNVIIKRNVEISNNTCIDRAVLGSTVIGENTKIDNLVHIAHGVKIGSNSLIIANSMIAGSTTIGNNVWVAPSASILNKINLGDNAVIGIGTVVLKDVSEKKVVVGNPGRELDK